MKRKIIRIDEEKCSGCGLCVNACQEGALKLVNGKAKLVSESYCDGLGACLPDCPTGALTIEEREADTFNEEADKKDDKSKPASAPDVKGHVCPGSTVGDVKGHVCPGSAARTIDKRDMKQSAAPSSNETRKESELRQWPCQIKLVPVNASYFENANILIAADCTAYAYANIHEDYMKNRITLIGCPKLDNVNYGDKLTEILKCHEIKSITVLKMEVPCCGGLLNAVKQAILNSGKLIPWSVVTIGVDGRIVEEL